MSRGAELAAAAARSRAEEVARVTAEDLASARQALAQVIIVCVCVCYVRVRVSGCLYVCGLAFVTMMHANDHTLLMLLLHPDAPPASLQSMFVPFYPL